MASLFSWMHQALIFLEPLIVFMMGLVIFWVFFRGFPSNRRFRKAYLPEGSPEEEWPERLIINWSGHKIFDVPWAKDPHIWGPSRPPHFDTSSWEKLEESIQDLIDELPSKYQQPLLQGDRRVVIAIPQLSAGLAILLALLHGKTGTFPQITSPLSQGEKGYILSPPLSLSQIRLKARENRNLTGGAKDEADSPLP